MSQVNCPKCTEPLQPTDYSPDLVQSRQKIFIHFCYSCAHIGLEIQGYLLKDNEPILHREINKNIQSKRLAVHLHCPSCMDKLGHHDPGYPPTFHSELTTKGIEIHSIQCGQPDCRGVIKQFQDKLIPFTSDKEKYEKIEPNQNLFKETLESQMEHKGSIADIMHSNTPFRSKSTDIPDDKHQREY